MDLREIENVNPWKNWYYQSKASAVVSDFEKVVSDQLKVLDVGAGSAFFSEFIQSLYPTAKIVCLDVNYKESQLGLHNGLEFVRKYEQSDSNLILFMDVLEHVENDRDLLGSYVRRVPPGSVVVITVPAFMTLWSAHDDFLGHFRRYTRKEVEKLATELDLEIVASRYLFSITLPIVYLMRKFVHASGSQMRDFPKFINSFLQTIHNFEHRFVRNKYFGLSVLLVARTKSSLKEPNFP